MQALLQFGQVAKEPAYLFDCTPHIPTKIVLVADTRKMVPITGRVSS